MGSEFAGRRHQLAHTQCAVDAGGDERRGPPGMGATALASPTEERAPQPTLSTPPVMLATLNTMKKSTEPRLPPESPISFVETTAGMAAGFWHCSVDGYRWVEGRSLNSVLGAGEVADPGPWLMANSDVARRYAVLTRPRLLEAMDELSEDPSSERILRFANRWGSLGEEQLIGVGNDKSNEDGGALTSGISSGEPLSVWRAHLLLYGDLRRLWRAVTVITEPERWARRRVRGARELLEGAIRWGDDGACGYDSRYEANGEWMEWHRWIYHPALDSGGSVARHISNRNTVEAARYYVHKQVNEQMRGRVSPSVLPFLDGALRLFPDSLAAAVWLRFAFELAGGVGRQRECEHCRQPFAVRRRDQRFCSKNCQEASAYRRRIDRKSLARRA